MRNDDVYFGSGKDFKAPSFDHEAHRAMMDRAKFHLDNGAPYRIMLTTDNEVSITRLTTEEMSSGRFDDQFLTSISFKSYEAALEWLQLVPIHLIPNDTIARKVQLFLDRKVTLRNVTNILHRF